MQIFYYDGAFEMRNLLKSITVFCVGLVTLNGYAEKSVLPTVSTSSITVASPVDNSTLASNQGILQTGQNSLAQNQYNMNENNKSWLADALTEKQAEELLLSDSKDVKGDNLVDQLASVMSASSEVESSAYMDQAVSLYQSKMEGSTFSQAKLDLMSDTVSLILSGAGNDLGSDTLWVSDVLDNVKDPSEQTLSLYNSAIYPYVALSSNKLSYEVSTCDKNVEKDTGASKGYCNLMKSVLYTQALVESCSGSYITTSSDSSTASSSTSTANQSSTASSSSATGPQYDSSSGLPDGLSSFGCSAAYYQDTYNAWNGWNTTLNAILSLQKTCKSLSSGSVSSTYKSMTQSIIDACSDFNSVVSSYNPKTNTDESSIAQDLLADLQTSMTNIIKYNRRLLVRQIFDYSMQDAVKKTPDMAYYGSLYTLIGFDSYDDNASSNTDAISQGCINMIKEGKYSFSVEVVDSTRQALASLLINQIGSMYPMRTVLPVVSLPKPSGASAAVAINGQVVALDSSGKVMTTYSSSSSTVPQISSDVSSVSSAQSSIQSAMVGASQLFQGQMDSYLKSKTAAITPLMDAYADRALVIKLKSGSKTCKLTPSQINKFAATYRLNPNVTFEDSNGTGTTASWSEHLATSSQSQVSKEIALLESQRTYQNYQDHVQNEKLALIGTLVPLMNSANQAMSLKAQSMMLDKMINDYVSGTKTTSSSSSAASSSSG
ncbi:MAG: hypothetical protein VX737_02320 [Pseudomonadota bacterium]|nr:hypothetical protein [Pseudomonadota bacterium]